MPAPHSNGKSRIGYVRKDVIGVGDLTERDIELRREIAAEVLLDIAKEYADYVPVIDLTVSELLRELARKMEGR